MQILTLILKVSGLPVEQFDVYGIQITYIYNDTHIQLYETQLHTMKHTPNTVGYKSLHVAGALNSHRLENVPTSNKCSSNKSNSNQSRWMHTIYMYIRL